MEIVVNITILGMIGYSYNNDEDVRIGDYLVWRLNGRACRVEERHK